MLYMLSSVQKQVVNLMHAVFTLSQQAIGENKHLNACVHTNSHIHKTQCTCECNCSWRGYMTQKYFDYCQNCMKFLNTSKG